MTKKYQVMANEYLNTGGNCMVDITTVYDRERKSLLYVFINEEGLVISTEDFIRNELPDDINTDDFVLVDISHKAFTTEPSPEDFEVVDLSYDDAQLLLGCLLTYIRNYVKHSGRNYFTTIDKLPVELYRQVSNDYSKWLDANDQMVETDGYKIIVDNRYYNELNYDTQNEASAKDLLQLLDECLPTESFEPDSMLWEKFTNEKLQIIYCDKLFTFENGADVYNALYDFAKYIIENQ